MEEPSKEPSPASWAVRGLALPTRLVELLVGGHWRHPGDGVLATVMPWFEDPLDFLTDVHQMRRETRSLHALADDESTARLFRLGRGDAGVGPVELPWLDVDLAVLVAVNHFAGDDVVVALDYRTGAADPRVVASDIWTDPRQYAWRTVAETFTAFTAALDLPGPRHYGYAGPVEILEQVRPGRYGRPIASHDDLAAWLAEEDGDGTFTFVIDLAGTLRLAPRRSEHVVCAGGEPVLSAGEITFVLDRDRWAVGEISNQSTGYCPDVSSWRSVAAALDRVGLDHPGAFTSPIVFRLCPSCRQRNIVKDDYYVCAVCGTSLPSGWNLGQAAEDAAGPERTV